jgi:hypothetical protein
MKTASLLLGLAISIFVLKAHAENKEIQIKTGRVQFVIQNQEGKPFTGPPVSLEIGPSQGKHLRVGANGRSAEIELKPGAFHLRLKRLELGWCGTERIEFERGVAALVVGKNRSPALQQVFLKFGLTQEQQTTQMNQDAASMRMNQRVMYRVSKPDGTPVANVVVECEYVSLVESIPTDASGIAQCSFARPASGSKGGLVFAGRLSVTVKTSGETHTPLHFVLHIEQPSPQTLSLRTAPALPPPRLPRSWLCSVIDGLQACQALQFNAEGDAQHLDFKFE